MSVIADFACDQNESITVTDQILQSDNVTPENITGWSLRAVIHALPGDGGALRTYTVGSGITIPTGTDGKLVLTMENADIVALGMGNFAYYIQRTDAGQEADLTRGTFKINAI